MKAPIGSISVAPSGSRSPPAKGLPSDGRAFLGGNMSGSGTARPPTGRWLQLWLGVLCMVLIANLQYAWTLFVDPMHQAHGWTIAEIQIAFSIFIATETWLTPIEGYIVDWFGPGGGP